MGDKKFWGKMQNEDRKARMGYAPSKGGIGDRTGLGWTIIKLKLQVTRPKRQKETIYLLSPKTVCKNTWNSYD